MARISVYQNDAALGIGGANRYSTRDATGAALGQAGNTLMNIGVGLQDERERANAKIEARSANMDNLRLHSALADHEMRVKQFADENAPNFLGEGADGSGYEKAVADFAANDAKTVVAASFAHRDQEEMQLRFTNSARPVVAKAGDDEFNTALRFQGDVSEKKIGGLATQIATNPDAYDTAAAEWIEFATTTNLDRPQLQSRMAQLGLAKLQRARIEAVAGRDPAKFRAATAGALSGGPIKNAPETVAAIVHGATDQGADPTTLLAIGHIESGLNAAAGNPMKDGKAMSSAVGTFQVLKAKDTLDELGITEDQRTNTAVVAPAIAAYIVRQTERMEANGIAPTPGKQYMTWNMGPGVAMAVMRASPNERMGDIVDRVLAKRSPEYRATFKRNNPSMYSAQMTAGEVLANYERKMATASKAVSKYVTGEGVTADESARDYFADLVPGGAPLLGAKDLGEITLLAKAKSAELSREQQSLDRGMNYVTGKAKADPRDSKTQKDVEEFVIKQGLSAGLVEGDREAHNRAAAITDNTGFMPRPFVNALSSAMAGGDVQGKMAAYVTLADLSARNPAAYDATKLQADERSRVNEYIALTTVSNLSPDDAVKRIDYRRSPEGRKQADAQKAGLLTSRDAEVKGLSDLDVVKHFDQSMWSQPVDKTGKFMAAATNAYKEQYVYHREQGLEPEVAKAQALSSLDRNWGTSSVADSRATQTFMPYPPEKGFKQVDLGNGPTFEWIADQAKNQAAAMVEQRYPQFASQYAGQAEYTDAQLGVVAARPSTLKSNIAIRLVPDLQTAHEVRNSQPRSYRLMVTLPNGTVDIDPTRFTPDQTQADREAAYVLVEGNKKTRARAAVPASPLILEGP